MNQAKAKIFLAGERHKVETGEFRTYAVFNRYPVYNKHKEPFEGVYLLNNETLGSCKNISYPIDHPTLVVILPIVGGVNCKTGSARHNSVAAGEVLYCTIAEGSILEISNPFQELVNMLVLFYRLNQAEANTRIWVKKFDLEVQRNHLLNLNEKPPGSTITRTPFFSIGKFDGRAEDEYRLRSGSNKLFIHVIQGVFETAGRLLHEGDSLAIWNCNEVDMEALSNDAIVFVAETEDLSVIS